MDLNYWLGHLYRTGVVKRGEGYDQIKQLFKDEMANNSQLRADMTQKQADLRAVDKARNGKDFLTHQLLRFLDEMEKELANG